MAHDFRDRSHRTDSPQRTALEAERSPNRQAVQLRDRNERPQRTLGDPVAAVERGLADARAALATVEQNLEELRAAVDPAGPRQMTEARRLARWTKIRLDSVTRAIERSRRWLPLVPELAGDHAAVTAAYQQALTENAALQAQAPADHRDQDALIRTHGRPGVVDFSAEEDRASREWNASLDARAEADRKRERPAATTDPAATYDEGRDTLEVGGDAEADTAPVVDRSGTRAPATIDAPPEYDERRDTLEISGERSLDADAMPEPEIDRSRTRDAATTDPAPVYDEGRDTLDVDGEIEDAAPVTGAVQRKASTDSGPDDVHRVAAAGVATASSELPHLDAIQASFGAHDVSQIRASIGGEAATAADTIGAEAYATGDRVAFCDAPSLHTAAHEAAHVVQQRAGVQLKSGVGEAGDSYEKHADAVADAVVRGESAAALLAEYTASSAATATAALQRKEASVTPFTPVVERSPATLMMHLGDTDAVDVSVVNAKTAPEGTEFDWKLRASDSHADTPGAKGADAQLAVLPRSIALHGQAQPEVTAKLPSGAVSGAVAPAVELSVLVPRASWKHAVASVGARGAGEPRKSTNGPPGQLELFAGDTAAVTLQLTDVGDRIKYFVDVKTSFPEVAGLPGKITAWPTDWIDDRTAVVTLHATHAGKVNVWVDLHVPGLPKGALAYELQVMVRNDLEGFRERCSAAHMLLDARYSDALSTFGDAAMRYKSAYDKQKSLLAQAEASERLADDILLNLFFAMAAGASGGAIAPALTFREFGSKAQSAFEAAARGAVTDVIKDLAKATTRIPQQLIPRRQDEAGASGAGADARAGKGSATGSVGAGDRGEFSPAAIDPVGFYIKVASALATERAEAMRLLAELQDGATQAIDQGLDMSLDFDPVAMVERSCRIDGVAPSELVVPEEAEYTKALWAAWLSTYAAKVTPKARRQGYDYADWFEAENNIDGGLADAISDVAEAQGESGERWIREFGASAWTAARAEAAEMNKVGE